MERRYGMKEINFTDLVFNPTNMLANEWMIVCAGNQDTGYNGMTVSWGHLVPYGDMMENTIFLRYLYMFDLLAIHLDLWRRKNTLQ